jgi:GxxExxY protein
VELPIIYKNHPLQKKYRVDFLCYDKIILELKATEVILPIHQHQLINYLRLSGKKLGFVMNFGFSSFQYKRIANLY